MNMVLSEEQQATQDAAHKLIQTHSPVSALRALRDRRDAIGYDPTLWAKMAEMGWPGVVIPEALGGLGLTPAYLSVVLEASGRTLASSPLWSSGLFASVLLTGCTETPLLRDTLTAMAAGERIVSVALEERARHAPEDIATTLSAEGQLNGRKQFVVNGHVANQLIVTARDAAGALALVLVAADQPGVQIERTWMVDAHNAATVTLNQVSVTPEQILRADDLQQVWSTSLDVARLGVAAEMLGTATEAFERTLAFLKEREQFGAIIGSFQALKHRAALMFVELELARSAVREGFGLLEQPLTDPRKLARLASIAKMQGCQTLHLVSNEAVQMHGGMGMTDEHDIGFFLKRARVLEQLLGDDRFHIDRYATLSGY